MPKKLVFIIFICNTLVLTAQKEANIWYFGNFAGIDFNSGSPVALLDGALKTTEGCATISNSDGELLFYTNGINIWDRTHNIMLNGNGLLGDDNSTQSAIIVPKPNSSTIYYVFTVDWQAQEKGLNYSEIDLTLNSGLGGVTSNKNINLIPRSTEQITAVLHENGKDYWVVCHPWDSNKFYSYLVTETGVNETPIESVTPLMLTWPPGSDGTNASIGQLKVSPNGTKLGICSHTIGTHVADFNSLTGEINNLVQISSRTLEYGLEFSPNSKLMYVTSQLGNAKDGIQSLFQYNLEAIDIGASEIIIAREFDLGNSLQLGPDRKIYAALQLGFISSIENPNIIGAGCNFIYESVDLNGRISAAGLPQFIQSYFNIQSILYENVCFGDLTSFELQDTVDTVVWNFGDPASGINNTSTGFEPTHVFSNPGVYEVSVTATVGTETATETTTVTIFEVPIANQPQNILVCDDDNDGFYSFDLTTQNGTILNGQDASFFDVIYYASSTDYANKSSIANPNNFVNTLAYSAQNIIVSVRNKNNIECNNITSFNIQVFETPSPSKTIEKLTICDNRSVGTDKDGIVEFDLTERESDILNGQSITDFEIKYYTDMSFSNEILNPNHYQNSDVFETIYIQVTNILNNKCVANTQFDIEVLELPIVASPVELKQCDDDLDGFSAFNLTEVIPKITSNASNETITFFESQTDAENNINSITNVTAYINETPSLDAVWARIQNENKCYRTIQVNLIVTTTQIPSSYTRDFYVCDDDTDGISTFDFSSVQTEIENMFPVGQHISITYYRNEADALAEENAIFDISNYRNLGYPNFQQIYVRVDGQLDNDCLGLGNHINLFVEPFPVANLVTIDRQCDDDQDGMFPFNVSIVESTVLGSQSLSDVSVSYFDENDNILPSPLPNPFLTSSQIIKIRVTNNNVSDGSCFDETTLKFIVDKQPIAYAVANLMACDDGEDDTDGLHDFDTSLIENTILNGQTGMEVYYFDETGMELSSPLPNPFLSPSQTITVNVVNPINNTCYDTTSFDLIVNPLPEFNVDTPQIVCSSDPTFTVVLDPLETNTSELFTYNWVYEDGTHLSNNSNLTVSTPGTYFITLTKSDGTGCSRTREIFVNASELATITQNDIIVVDNSNNNTITIVTNSLGQGDYEFALDDEYANFQDEPFFDNVSSGIHTIYVRDKKGCGTSSIDVSVIGYPKFFTPNGDGINDFWQVEGVNGQFQTNSDIFIFNRYGKLIKQLATTSNGWDGTVNGQMLPTDDYWFRVYLQDGREFMGHFAIKR